MESSQSYRDSHQAKGSDYDRSFRDSAHLAMLWRMERRVLTGLVRELFPERPPVYLDFASGTGRILRHMGPMVKEATGVDVSASMLEVARKSAPSAEILHGDITRDDVLRERRFDLITAFRFFPNAELPLRTAAISSLVRHLQPNGFLVFNNHQNTSSLARKVSRWLGRAARPESETMSRREVADLVAGAGLAIVREYPLASLPFTDLHMLRPEWLLEGAERVLSCISATVSIAQNIIYVCALRQKAGPRP